MNTSAPHPHDTWNWTSQFLCKPGGCEKDFTMVSMNLPRLLEESEQLFKSILPIHCSSSLELACSYPCLFICWCAFSFLFGEFFKYQILFLYQLHVLQISFLMSWQLSFKLYFLCKLSIKAIHIFPSWHGYALVKKSFTTSNIKIFLVYVFS